MRACAASTTFTAMTRKLWTLARRYFLDFLIVAAAIAGSVEVALQAPSVEHGPSGPVWVDVPALLALPLPLLARRRFPFAAPLAVVALAGAISFADGGLIPFSFFAFLAVLTACFFLGMLRERAQAVAGIAFTIGMVVLVASNDPTGGIDDVVGVFAVVSAVWIAGFALGPKLRQIAEAEERAARAEREREERARGAVAEERARIARELHDVVGHSVSVMTVQASAVRRLLRPDQAREREALLVVEQTGREALAEMRRMVGVLRRPEEAPALAPQPSLEHLEKLIEQVEEAGLPVELRVEGRPIDLPAGVDLTAYRLVQEGLTNALKHAGAARAEVLVRYGDAEVELVVSDDGRGQGEGDGGGHGLLGMRERVAVYGGELDAGPRPEGGYALRARLPVEAP
jgi:signal transduction histidine kinase